MKITNGGWKKRGATKIINFDEKIDGGRGGGMKDRVVTVGGEAFKNDCAMVKSKRCVKWLEKS